jgi:hypothetical protein
VLLSALEQDRYVVELPEHAALPAAALLLSRGHHEQALDLVAQLWPLMHRLRLTPRLVDDRQPMGTLVHLESVGEVRQRLQGVTTPLQVQAMHATMSVWNPLHDDLLRLWAQTVEGDLPHLAEVDGATVLSGGWPCRRFPPDWAERRQELLERYEQAATRSTTPTRHLHRTSSTTRLVEALRTCPRGQQRAQRQGRRLDPTGPR